MIGGVGLDTPFATAQSGRMNASPSPSVKPAGSARFEVLRTLVGRPIPAVMGVLNITPDSFSDGGAFIAPALALARARAMIADGVDIIDIGAESTRPYKGARPVTAAEELARLKPVLPEVVAFALAQGAAIANDVWGLQGDAGMAPLIAARGAPVIVMHNRDSVDPTIDIVADMKAFFLRSLDVAAKAGIARDKIVLDPGIGFGKTVEQSMTALARLRELDMFGLPILVGASRKRFIASVSPSEPSERLAGSIAAHLIAAQRGARIIRTHDVAETLQALRVAHAIESKP